MKKFLPLLIVVALMFAVGLQAQTLRPLKKVQELKMPKTAEDEMPGKRGASVVWHPEQKKYYSVFAGNSRFPLAVFDVNGKRLSDADLVAMADTRGIWYNSYTKAIFGNGFGSTGWFEYKLDKKGMVTDVEISREGMNQPGSQCVGVYNTEDKQVLFLYGSQVYMYSNNGILLDSMVIHWGRKKADGASEYEELYLAPEDYNNYSMIYTGIKGQELGFENLVLKQVELYDIKTGFLTKILTLPEIPETEGNFNFAYANGIYWLFDIGKRTWMGYK